MAKRRSQPRHKSGPKKGQFKSKKRAKRRKTTKRKTKRRVKRVSARRGTTVVVKRSNPGTKKRGGKKRTKASRRAAALRGIRKKELARAGKSAYRPYMRAGRKASPKIKRRIVTGGWGRTHRGGRAAKGSVVLNPGSTRGGLVKSLQRNVMGLLKPAVWIDAAQSTLGVSAALVLPMELAGRVAMLRPYNQGYYGIALSAVSTAVGATVAAALPMKGSARLAQNVMAGGMLATFLKLGALLAPQYMGRLLPGLSVGGGAPRTMPRGPVNGLSGYYSQGGYPTNMLGSLEWNRAARLPQGVASGSFTPARGEQF